MVLDPRDRARGRGEGAGGLQSSAAAPKGRGGSRVQGCSRP